MQTLPTEGGAANTAIDNRRFEAIASKSHNVNGVFYTNIIESAVFNQSYACLMKILNFLRFKKKYKWVQFIKQRIECLLSYPYLGCK